jgi:TusE/DsrC/DsvC family sulfur relay protein
MAIATVLDGISFNSEGYMTDPNQWTREIAETLAAQEGIVLTPDHWKIIDFCRRTTLSTGKSPTMRSITNGTGITTKELFALFPGGPGKKVAKISGVSKPEGCV